MRHLQSFVAALILGLLLGLITTPALADVVVVVSEENRTRSLSRTELEDIYLGRRRQFPNGTSAVPLDQRDSSAAYAAFYSEYLGRTPAQIRTHWSRLIFTGRGQPPRNLAGDEAVAEVVRNNPNAVGYIDSSLVTEGLRVLDID